MKLLERLVKVDPYQFIDASRKYCSPACPFIKHHDDEFDYVADSCVLFDNVELEYSKDKEVDRRCKECIMAELDASEELGEEKDCWDDKCCCDEKCCMGSEEETDDYVDYDKDVEPYEDPEEKYRKEVEQKQEMVRARMFNGGGDFRRVDKDDYAGDKDYGFDYNNDGDVEIEICPCGCKDCNGRK